MVRVVKHPAERRSELVSAAAALFYSRGYATTSVSDIIDAVGVAKGTFYYYFDSKLAILEAMIEGLVEQQVAVLHEIVADDENGLLASGVELPEPAPSGIPAFDPDPAELAAAIDRLVDPDERERLTAGAVAARSRFSWETTVNDVAALLDPAPRG